MAAMGQWVAQFHPATGAARDQIYFDSFAATLAYVKSFKKRKRMSGDILRVHTPSTATVQQRDELKENGCIPM